ncbi:Crp/Fnr family transcriptional regulator [Jonesiaceae bacterium BS-20]|uniref:Crp/Fnr family transcriptional regulator n=1 Tax=Jonesiaceae bacterium BS-20 TaxID=3120821 RepID=A0AAU7DUE5_9MICO
MSLDDGVVYCHHGHTQQDRAELVSQVPLFANLAPEVIFELAGRVQPRDFNAKEMLYTAGSNNSSLLIVHHGKVKTYRISESGHEQVLRVLGPGDFLGENTLLAPNVMDHFAQTLETAEVCYLSGQDFKDYLLQYPEVSYQMLSALSTRLGQTESQVSTMGGDSVDKRVAQYLLATAREKGTHALRLAMSKKDLASFLGITPETLSRKLSAFEQSRWISLRGQREVTILDAPALNLVN